MLFRSGDSLAEGYDYNYGDHNFRYSFSGDKRVPAARDMNPHETAIPCHISQRIFVKTTKLSVVKGTGKFQKRYCLITKKHTFETGIIS